MSKAGKVIAFLLNELRRGNVSEGTAYHLKFTLQKVGWHASDDRIAAPIVEEICRLEREANTLRNMYRMVFDAGGERKITLLT